MLTQREMLDAVQAQLAIEMNCTVDDLNGEKDSVVFVEAKENPGRRPFPRKERHFEILSMGKSIVVSATPERLSIARTQMQGKDRDSIFALPFIRGLYLHYLPDLKTMKPVSPPEGFAFDVIERDRAASLFDVEGFGHAIIYDRKHPYHTDVAVLARKDGAVVGVAGASHNCAKLWQIGIEVSPGCRNRGLAVYLANSLTFKILQRGYVPTYSAISSNIASQRVAHRAGLYVAWVSDWRCNFEGFETPQQK